MPTLKISFSVFEFEFENAGVFRCIYLISLMLLGYIRDPMITTTGSDDPKEPVYEDFRQLFAQKERLRTEKRSGSPIGLLQAFFSRRTERAAELLERRLVLSLAGCLSLILAGLSVFLIQGPHRNQKPSVDLVTTSGSVEPALSRRGSMDIVSDVKDFAEDRTEADRPSHSLIEDSTSEVSETFIIRIGSFRNPSNANRVVESLRKRRLDVKTEVLADGLHVLMLGPFLQKGAADDAARSVRESIGLAPQVLRLDFK
jgi:hypothetical protein